MSSTALATVNPQTTAISSFSLADTGSFEHAIKVADFLSKSSLIPVAFQKNQQNCIIALEMSARMGIGAFTVMQNLDIIHGKPSWRSQFIIGMINASRRFSAMRFKYENAGQTDEKKGPTWSCYAYAKSLEDGEEVKGVTIDVAMAKKEGWWGKLGSKWPVMTELMLMYRAATLFGRMYAPDMLNGLQTADEALDTSLERNLPVIDAAGNPVTEEQPKTETESTESTRPKRQSKGANAMKTVTPEAPPSTPTPPPVEKPVEKPAPVTPPATPAPTPAPEKPAEPVTPVVEEPAKADTAQTSAPTATTESNDEPIDLDPNDNKPLASRCEVVSVKAGKANSGAPLSIVELKGDYNGRAFMFMKDDKEAFPAGVGNVVDVTLEDKTAGDRTNKIITSVTIVG